MTKRQRGYRIPWKYSEVKIGGMALILSEQQKRLLIDEIDKKREPV